MKKKKLPKMPRIPHPLERKPETDLDSINMMLKNSFSAIKLDMLHLKEAQEEQMKDMGSLQKEVKDFKQGCATKEEIRKLQSSISTLDINQKAIASKVEELEKYTNEIIKAVNERIKELNKEFEKILTIKDNLNFKLKSFDRLEDDFKDLRKRLVTKTQLKQVVDDINKEFDQLESEFASKKDLLKHAKRVEKLTK